MACIHLTMKELGWIETYYEIGLKPYKIAKKLGRSNQLIYNVINFLKEGGTIKNYFDRYKQVNLNMAQRKRFLQVTDLIYQRSNS